MSRERAWFVCAFAGMRMGMGRAATMPKARVEATAKTVENCILMACGGLVWLLIERGNEKAGSCVLAERANMLVKSVSWKLKRLF